MDEFLDIYYNFRNLGPKGKSYLSDNVQAISALENVTELSDLQYLGASITPDNAKRNLSPAITLHYIASTTLKPYELFTLMVEYGVIPESDNATMAFIDNLRNFQNYPLDHFEFKQKYFNDRLEVRVHIEHGNNKFLNHSKKYMSNNPK
jgi:hypothetical protein